MLALLFVIEQGLEGIARHVGVSTTVITLVLAEVLRKSPAAEA